MKYAKKACGILARGGGRVSTNWGIMFYENRELPFWWNYGFIISALAETVKYSKNGLEMQAFPAHFYCICLKW